MAQLGFGRAVEFMRPQRRRDDARVVTEGCDRAAAEAGVDAGPQMELAGRLRGIARLRPMAVFAHFDREVVGLGDRGMAPPMACRMMMLHRRRP